MPGRFLRVQIGPLSFSASRHGTSPKFDRWRNALRVTKEIVRLMPDQFEPARVTLGQAFENYPLMTYALAEPAGRLKAVTSLYGSILWDCLMWGEVYSTSDLAGVACWLPPGRTSASLMRLIRSGMLRLPFVFGWTGFRRLTAYEDLAHKLHHAHAPGNHWYLWAIGVRPADQGKGLARQLVAPILAQIKSPCPATWKPIQKRMSGSMPGLTSK